MIVSVANQYCSYIAALIGMPHSSAHIPRIKWLVRTPVCTAPSIYHAEAIRVYQELSVFYAHFTLLVGQINSR